MDLESEKNLIFDLSLSRISFLSLEDKKKLKNNIDSADSLALLSIEDIEKITEKSFSNRIKWNGTENLRMAQRACHYCHQLGIQIVLYDDPAYPELLRQIPDPPYLLFCRGDISLFSKKSVSVVGTRKISQNGKISAIDFGYSAALDNCCVISGLANGVDGYSHQGAVNAYFDAAEKKISVENLGKTIAVLPSGIDSIVPAGHKKLAETILQTGGLIVSEYEPGFPVYKWNFVARDRLIAGLSPATVVIEAPAGSGALITADFALENGRDVLFHEAAFGNHAVQISSIVKRDLEVKHAAGTVSKYKLENTPEKFLEAGAPVIKDYNDYVKCLAEMPGIRSSQPVQGELF